MSYPVERVTTTVFRAHNPRLSFAPASGTGAAKHGGRFNRPGMPALYTSDSYQLAITEAQQGLPFKIQPLTIVSYDIDHTTILDLTSTRARRAAEVKLDELASPWEAILDRGCEPPSWTLADQLISHGVGGIKVPSFAHGAPTEAANIVFWSWSDRRPERVVVVDDEQRLPRNDSSWR